MQDRGPIKDGRNWYVYCGNNPISFADPDGLKKLIIVIGAGVDDEDRDEPTIPRRFEDLAGEYREKFEGFGWEVVIIRAPSASELIDLLREEQPDGIVFIGHGNPGWGRLRGKGAKKTGPTAREDRLTPRL